MSPSRVRCRAEGRKRRGKRIVINPFSKVGVRAAQDGRVHLELSASKKKISMMVQYYAQTPDGKASHRATFFVTSTNRGGFLMAHTGNTLTHPYPQDMIKKVGFVCLFVFFLWKNKAA